MPRHVIMRRTNRTLAGGRVRIRLPEVAIYLPSRDELALSAAKAVEQDCRRRLRSAPGRWSGLGRRVESEVVADSHGVRVPSSTPVVRMQQAAPQTELGVSQAVLDEVTKRWVDAGVRGQKPGRAR